MRPRQPVDTVSLLAWHRCVTAIERLQARAAAELSHPEPRVRLLRTLALMDQVNAASLDRLHLGTSILATLAGGPAAISAFVDARCDELKSLQQHAGRVLELLRDTPDAPGRPGYPRP